MRQGKYLFCLILILTIVSSCEIDPCDPMYKYYIANLSEDSVVCTYKMKNANNNTIELAKGETSILYRKNKTDTLMPSPYISPKVLFTEILFSSINGDTLLYISPVEDGMWMEFDTVVNVYDATGSKWLYEYSPENVTK